MYVHDTVYEGASATRTPAFPYELLYKPLNLTSGYEIVVGLAQQTPGIGSFVRQSLVSFDGTNWQTLKANVVDLTAVGSTVYTLDYNPVSGSNELRMANYAGVNALTWSTLPLSNVPTNAKAIEVLGDMIYVGNTAGRLWMGKLDGSPAVATPPTVVNELSDGFGRAIAVDATTLVIGAPEFSGSATMSGQVTVWTRTMNGIGGSRLAQPETHRRAAGSHRPSGCSPHHRLDGARSIQSSFPRQARHHGRIR